MTTKNEIMDELAEVRRKQDDLENKYKVINNKNKALTKMISEYLEEDDNE